MAAKKTLYVPENDLHVWESAENLSRESLSALVGRLLKAYVGRVGHVSSGADETLLVQVYDEESGSAITKRFRGKWLWSDPIETSNSRWNVGVKFSAALTVNRRIVVVTERGNDLDMWEHFDVYDNINDAADELPEDICSAIANAIGEEGFVEDLDI